MEALNPTIVEASGESTSKRGCLSTGTTRSYSSSPRLSSKRTTKPFTTLMSTSARGWNSEQHYVCWIDKPTLALSSKQLQDDLDLFVVAPSGFFYNMWGSGEKDNGNVNKRVVVPAESIESGKFSVTVSVGDLLTDSQSYSLVVTAAIVAHSTNGVDAETRSVDTTNGATDIVDIIIEIVASLVVLALVIGGVWAIKKYYCRR